MITIFGKQYLKNIDECPSLAKHTFCPKGYLQWHSWAEKKSKTHHQVRCEDCNYLAIWRRNK